MQNQLQQHMLTPIHLLLIITATSTALMAGLFFAWSVSVMPGIALLPDAAYIAAMQAMNTAILNPVFFAAFFGTLGLLPLSTWLQYSQPLSPRFWLLLSATILYAAGVFGVTFFGNVPLNDTLGAFPLQSATAGEIAALRIGFEGPWNNLNNIRTIASTLSILLVIIACLSHTNISPADSSPIGK